MSNRLKAKIIGSVDTASNELAGLREMVQLSVEILKGTKIMEEKGIVREYLRELVKEKPKAIYGFLQSPLL